MFIALTAGTVATAAGLLISAPAANAASCPSPNVCFYEHTSYAGLSKTLGNPYAADLSTVTWDGFNLMNLNDKISSIISGQNPADTNAVHVYSNINFSGTDKRITPGGYYPNLGDFGLNDKVSSFRRVSGG
ncbi:peptidase inhibitor family I36 protein [Streptomyces sp. NPDC095817]|uniref:peptidase inhibitor family I36 protein n=1 Tax=Streptomyces sp. NPDC095817 TaxID=3155082 RepID=UPI00332085CF